MYNLQDIKCDNPNFELTKLIKYGSCVKCIYKCTECKFTSPCVNLFDEIKTPKRGPNPGELTRMLVSALQETPIGIKRGRFLMAAGLNIPPPTKRTLQRHSNFVANEIKELNDNDMKKKLETVKEVNRIRGVKEPSHIPVAIDTRYNSMHIVSTKKPGQNASQAISLACEQVTDHKFIVASVFHNKLCWTGSWLKGKGLNVTCPDGHAGTCTANVKPTNPLSEYLMGKEIGLQIDRQNVLVKYAVTDGDGRGAEGINDALKVLHPLWKVERQADPIHLGRSQFRQSNSANFSLNMFYGSTREKKKQGQKVLSQDLKARCSLVFNEMWKENCGNLEKIKKCLPRVLDATVRCYTGDCSKCPTSSYVCGGGHTNCWWLRSMYLGANKLTNLNMDDNDKLIMQELLKMKLSEEALMKMKFNFNTQKCEAVNRALSVSLPKNVNFSRNFEGRASAIIHTLNNGIANSWKQKAECIGFKISQGSFKHLEQMQRECERNKVYQNTPERKKKNLQQTGQKIKDHVEEKEQSKFKDRYQKGQLDPKLNTAFVQSTKDDHSYGRVMPAKKNIPTRSCTSKIPKSKKT